MPNVRPQKSICDFSTFTVTCTYGDKPLSVSDPVLIEIVKKALRNGTQTQSVPGLVPVRKRGERRLRPDNQVDKGITATKEVNEW